MEIPPQTQYAPCAGVSIAYQVFGPGPPLVMAPIVPSHLDLMWIDPAYTQILRRLGSFARVAVLTPAGSACLTHAQVTVDAIGDLGIKVRAGLHTGECESVGDDLAGLAVIIGARAGAQARPGELWVSDLVSGSGMRFHPRGTHDLKGVPGHWELYSLADGNTAAVVVAQQPPATRATDRAILATARRAPAMLRLAGRLAPRRRVDP